MERKFKPIHTGSDADLAFAVVVLASYFTTFSSIQSATTSELLWMISLGVAYIAMGIYGYSLVVRSGKLAYHLAYFAVQITLGGAIVYLGKGGSFNAMVLLPLAGHSVVLLPRTWRLVINLFIIGAYVVAFSLLEQGFAAVWSGMPLFLGGQIFIVVFTMMAVNEERARTEAEKLYNELAEANQHLREYALQAEELAITKERNRLAREIHDGLGHYLTTIHMQIQAARAVMKVDLLKAQEAMMTAQNLTQEALVDVRRSVAALRDAQGDDLPLHDELDKLIRGCDGAGVTGELKIIGSPRQVSAQARWAIYRAVQEGINNTCKHAQATQFCVAIDYSRHDQVRLVIQDNGVGAAQTNGGFGLLGMRERVKLLGGEFEVMTAPGEGFRLEVRLPG